ncbi:MAG: flavin reductase family protein [Bacteroidota bacterium]|jgi:flavin reductase (DIM6/NTAB) family NADH-FMN oxidoreductase RutF
MKQFSRGTIEAFDQRFRTSFVNSLWGFKSVCLVGTQSAEGNTNLAVFSQVFHLGASPALVGMIVRPPEADRHTYENLKETGWFTLNHINPDIVEKAHQTAARYPREQSEFDAVGLTPIWTDGIIAPYVTESHLRIGCRFDGETEIKQNGTVLIIGKVEEVWLDESALQTDGYIDLEQLQTVTSSNLDSYHTTTRIARYAYAKPNEKLKKF